MDKDALPVMIASLAKEGPRPRAAVALKDGGPTMTVRVIAGDTAYCEWYEQGRLKQGTFLLESLAPARPFGPTQA